MKKHFISFITAGLMLFSPAALAEEQWLWPVKDFYNISSGFGQRSFSYHKGIDIAGPEANRIAGEPVLAAKSGVILAASADCSHNYPKASSCGCGGGYGNYVYLMHPDGVISRYGHMTSVLVEEGQAVRQGEVIGTVGSTGSSGGHHLHFEIRDAEDTPVNPMPENPENLHTYIESSAPFSESIPYIYSVASTSTVRNADGTYATTLSAKQENAMLLFREYANGNLIHFEARPFAGRAIVRTPLPESDTITVTVSFPDGVMAETEKIEMA